MSKDRLDNIANFIDTIIDELANSDIKFVKGIKTIFRVGRSGKNVIDGENNTAFNNFMETLRGEFKKLARSPRTDENHFREILKNIKLFFDDEESLINYYRNKEELVKKIRDNTSVPRESELPSVVADIIIDNITKLVPAEEWCKAVYDEVTYQRVTGEKNFETISRKQDVTNNHLSNLNGMIVSLIERKPDVYLLPYSFNIIDDHKSYIEDFQAPLFLDNNEDNSEEIITLQQMYVAPYDADSSNRFAYDTINTWYNLGSSTKRTMFVFGDAGVGKSSLCSKMIYDAYYNRGDKGFCIPADKLHICRLRSKIKEIEEAKINNVNDFLGILFELKKYEFDNDLFVLDGFDELCVLIKNKFLINTIITKLKQFRGDCKILITSRNSEEYFNENILKSSDKIKILNIKWKPSNIDIWCEKYAELTSSKAIRKWCKDFPEKYNKFPKDDKRREIFCVPIILYISAKAEIDVEEHNSVGKIYDEAFRTIAHRDYSELQEGMDNFNEDAEEKQRLINWQFTKEVAYQMFLNDTLYISDTRDSKLLDNAKNRTVTVLKERSVSIKKEEIEIPQYLAMFHFARPGSDGLGIEFAHKTVYEYFTAVKLYEDYFAEITEDYPEPNEDHEMLEKVWTNIIEAFRYASIDKNIFTYLNKMKLPVYNGKVNNEDKDFDFKKFESYFVEGMEQRILADLEIKSRVKEYIIFDTLLTTQISCAFRNLTWFLTGHGYYNEENNDKCKRFGELVSIYFGNLNLKNWKLSGADLSGADLREADLRGANLSGADLSRANLSGANLSGANLSRANLSGADLREAYLRGAHLIKANLSGAKLHGADLFGANLSEANLNGADLSGANLSRADLSGAELSEADLSDACLSNANLIDVNLIDANLSDAYLSDVFLGGADLSNSNLTNVVLVGSDLSYAILNGADLKDANLDDVEFSGTELSFVRFNNYTTWMNAMYCCDKRLKTKFPEGFDPKEHDMIEVNFLGNPVKKSETENDVEE